MTLAALAKLTEIIEAAHAEGHAAAMELFEQTDEQRLRYISELITALQDLRVAATEAYKRGHIPAEPFVRAGNLIANARAKLSAFGPCVRCHGEGIDPENGTDMNPEPDCERCFGTGDEGDAPAKPRPVQLASMDDCKRMAAMSQKMRATYFQTLHGEIGEPE